MTRTIEPGAIYRAHEQAFRHTSAYVVLKDGELVARVAFQFAKSGLRTTCWLHYLGTTMTKAFASGGGYDKGSAAAHKAARLGVMRSQHDREPDADYRNAAEAFQAFATAIRDEGRYWDQDLQAAGFTVLQAV